MSDEQGKGRPLPVVGSRVFLVEQGENPSSDYFVVPLLGAARIPFSRCRASELPSASDVEGACVVFVRYVPAAWKRFVEQNRSRLAGVHFFMDDDLFDHRAFAGMPMRYRWKLFNLAWRHQKWLQGVGAELWVSTPYLARKYSEWRPRLLEARAPFSPAEPAMKTLFYHGSASHRGEMEWLYPVVERVLDEDEQLAFEIIGDRSVRRMFQKLPRVHVLHPMGWSAYQALLRRPGRTIGLAPLLDSPFNQARAPTKFFDITRAGAVGIYAAGDVYDSAVEHDVNGLLLPMDREQWVAAILALSKDEARRERLLAGARRAL